jgi:hypothetical protein
MLLIDNQHLIEAKEDLAGNNVFINGQIFVFFNTFGWQ